MDELDYWRLCDELTIAQAALLMVGESAKDAELIERSQANRPDGYDAVKHAICGGLKRHVPFSKMYNDEAEFKVAIGEDGEVQLSGFDLNPDLTLESIAGVLVPESKYDEHGNFIGDIEGSVDVTKSTVRVDSLKKWLMRKGITKGFFFPVTESSTEYLDPTHKRYSRKLAASVKAWQAVTDPGKKSPKQALDKWLREHASEFGLTTDEGNVIEKAVEECSKVANWNSKGGATKAST